MMQDLRRRHRSMVAFALVTFLLCATPSFAGKKKTKKKKAPTTVTQPAADTAGTTTQTPATATAPAQNLLPASDNKSVAASERELEAVLTQIDRASENFRSCEADFVWEQYQRVVDEHDVQKGRVYFLHHEKDIHMAADVQSPETKYLLFSEGKVRLYQPKIEQVTEYDVGKKKAEFESFLVLGFGGRGHDLPSAFQVSYQGTETMEGTKVVKLDLVPKAAKVHNMFDHITVWVDATRDVSLKQQFFEPSGDYRIALYSNFKMNQKINDDVFKLKISSRTKVVRPQ